MTPKLKILFAQYSPFVTLLIAIVIFSALSPRFATPANLQVILSNSAELGLLVMPLALLVMSGISISRWARSSVWVPLRVRR